MDRQDKHREDSDEATRSWFAPHRPPVPDGILFDPTQPMRTESATDVGGHGGHGRAGAARVVRGDRGPHAGAPAHRVMRRGQHRGPGATSQLAPLPTHLNLRASDFLTPSLGFVAAPHRI